MSSPWPLLNASHHSPITRDFGIRLAKLSRFAEMVERHISDQATALGEEIEAAVARLPEDDRLDYYEYHAGNFYELGDELPSILRFAVLTAADSALEWYLATTCATFTELRSPRIALGDLHGRGVERSRTYLEKVAGIDFPDSRPSWQQVRKLHDLRNSVVHASGVISKERLKAIRLWATHFPGVRISDEGVIALDEDFTDAALAAYADFGLELDQALAPLGLWASVFPVIEVDDG